MRPEPSTNRPVTFWAIVSICTVLLTTAWYAACASSPAISGGDAGFRSPGVSTLAPDPDPRVGLRPGRADEERRIVETAAEASWNLRLAAHMPTPEPFVGVTNSDLAFTGNYVIQGNYNGVQVWDITNPTQPTLKKVFLCPASQSDVSVYKHLLFVSAESGSARLDCGTEGVEDSVSHDRIRGIRIFDATDNTDPKYIANVQTCRGSHTHTVVSDPNDAANVYVYISGRQDVRSPTEVPGCSDLAPEEDPNSTHFRIEVIRVPLANPIAASVVGKPGILVNLGAAPASLAREADRAEEAAEAARRAAAGQAGEGRGGGRRGRNRPERRVPLPPGPTQCHDITVYPAIGLAGGACGGFGLLLDIRDAANP
ncbi:MAG: LVIVD repeat-containing protein, partial [Longimicrobiales bacterium]